ncbi:MAG: urea transporter [Chloroflexota bacterium]|nr:urea transporter [Chloroflexota bacterium]
MNLPTRLFLPWRHAAAHNMLVGFIDELLRGFGQVMFQNSPITGLCFLVGLFVGGWQFGVYGLLGTAASTLAARWIGVPDSAVRAGLYGYNGTLVGVALAYYLAGNALLPVYVVFGGIVSAIVAGAVGNVLATWQVPALTGPFVVTTWFFALGIYGLDQLEAGVNSGVPALPSVASGARANLDLGLIWDGLLRGVSQVFFQDSVIVGIIFLVGILASSRIDCVMAVAGSAVGIATGWALGVDSGSLTLGLMGYNAVLTLMALAGLFYVLDRVSFFLALIAGATSVVVTVALSAFVAPYGGHIYTAPFVVTTWIFIAAKPFLHRVRAVPPADATTPEGNLNLYRVTGHWWEHASKA